MKHILSGWISKVLISFIALFTFSCATTAPEEIPIETIEVELVIEEPEEKALSATQEKVVEGAHWALGKTQLNVNGRVFNLDCSGTVMAIYYHAGIDLARDFAKYSGGGTERIFKYLEDKELLYHSDMPSPGDIIFWDNTYDKNGDGQRNDYLTHVGIVVDVEEDGTVSYLHEHYKKGIILEKMNLKYPDDVERNAAMRMRGTGMDGGWLSSHLYRILAMGYLLDE